MEIFKNLFNILEIFSPVVVYLFLFLIIRVVLEKLYFLKTPVFKNTFFLIKNILHVLIFMTSLIFTLGICGIDIQGIITSLGLLSFAIGFALKDVISNFLSSLSILLYGPFKVGDSIIIDGYEGIVIKMDTRYTVLQAKEDICYVPNSYIANSKIIIVNHSIKQFIKQEAIH